MKIDNKIVAVCIMINIIGISVHVITTTHGYVFFPSLFFIWIIGLEDTQRYWNK